MAERRRRVWQGAHSDGFGADEASARIWSGRVPHCECAMVHDAKYAREALSSKFILVERARTVV